MVKVEYKNDVEREQAISDNAGLLLIEEQIHQGGNFLVFGTDAPVSKKTVDEELADIKTRLTALEVV